MSSQFVKLSTVVVGAGGQASITFDNFSSSYTDLYLVGALRTSRTSGGDYAFLKLNSVDPTNTRWLWNSAGSVSIGYTSTTYIITTDSSMLSNLFGNFNAYIGSYNSTGIKGAVINSVAVGTGAGDQGIMYSGVKYESGSPSSSAITSVVLTPRFGSTFVQHSKVTLYGIKNSA